MGIPREVGLSIGSSTRRTGALVYSDYIQEPFQLAATPRNVPPLRHRSLRDQWGSLPTLTELFTVSSALPVAESRVRYELSRPWPSPSGVTELVMEPLSFLKRLAALLPSALSADREDRCPTSGAYSIPGPVRGKRPVS